MMIDSYSRLLPSPNDAKSRQLRELQEQAIPVDTIDAPSWRDIFPDAIVTISQEALDLMRHPPAEIQEFKKASGLTAEKLTDLDAFREAFGPPKLRIYEIDGNSVFETPPLGKLDQFVELEARYRANIEQFIPEAEREAYM